MPKNCNIKNKFLIKEIQAMLKLIPNNFPVCLEDLEEIFKQDGKKTNSSNSPY